MTTSTDGKKQRKTTGMVDPFQDAADDLDHLLLEAKSLYVFIQAQFHGGTAVFSVISADTIQVLKSSGASTTFSGLPEELLTIGENVSLVGATAPKAPPLAVPNRYITMGPYGHEIDLVAELFKFKQHLEKLENFILTARDDCDLLREVVEMLACKSTHTNTTAVVINNSSIKKEEREKNEDEEPKTSITIKKNNKEKNKKEKDHQKSKQGGGGGLHHYGHITPEVVKNRSAYVDQCRQEIQELQQFLEEMREECDSRLELFPEGKAQSQRGKDGVLMGSSIAASTSRPMKTHHQRTRGGNGGAGNGTAGAFPFSSDGGDIWTEAEAHEQTVLREETNEALDVLHHGVVHLKEKANTIKEEMGEQMEILDELETEVTGVNGRLQYVNKKVNYIVDHMSDRGKTCCILLLCFVLGALLAALLLG